MRRDEQARATASELQVEREANAELVRKIKLAQAEVKAASQVAKKAKDAACETRFGGKFLCLRPFNSGY